MSENNENFNKRVVTKSKSNNINYICNNDKNNYNNNTSNEEDEDDDLDDFTDEEFQSVSSLDTGSFSSRSLNSSPTSDIWLLPNNHSSNDKLNDGNLITIPFFRISIGLIYFFECQKININEKILN